MSQYQQIIELIRKSEVALFIGSGFSLKAGAPSGEDLCNTLYNALPDTIKEEKSIRFEYTLQNLSETYETHYGREALINLLKNTFNFEPKDTTDQKQLASIPQFKHIITTNYDTLIEDAYSSNCIVIATSTDLSKIDSRKPVIYKIHGDFSHPKNIVITKDDYSRLYEKKQENLIWDSTRVLFSHHNILFIGYSLSDPNIKTLVKYVKERMGEAAKQLFVLVPSVEETALLQLKKLGVEYIQGTAEDLFNELIPALKDHIVADFEQQTTSSEDCAQFLREYDLCPQVELGGPNTPNKLITVKSVSGKSVQHTFNFKLKGNGLGNPIDQIKPYRDERFDNLPVKKITDFEGFEHRANGILMSHGEDICAIYMVTVPKKGEICISIPQKRILQKATCRYYKNCEEQLQIDANIDVGEFQIMIPIEPNTTCGFRLKNNEKYTNSATAIAWANIFYAIFSGCEFTLSITSEENITRRFTYTFKKSKLRQELKQSKMVLQYYKYIQEIEFLMGTCFAEYQNFTEERLKAAEIIYHYLKKEPIIVRHASKGFEYELKTTSPSFNSRDKKEELVFIESYSNICYSLNGKVFTIPYMQIIYKQSILKSVKKDPNGVYIACLVDKAKDHRIQLTDHSIQVKTSEGIVDL